MGRAKRQVERIRLTEPKVRKLAPSDRERIVWDELVPNLGVRLQPRGGKSYVVSYFRDGKAKRHTIGPTAKLTIDAARDAARQANRDIHNDRDPHEVKKARRVEPTIGEILDAVEEYEVSRLKPGTIKRNETLDRKVRKHFGPMRASRLTTAMVAKVHNQIAANAPRSADLVLHRLRRCIKLGRNQLGLLPRDTPDPTEDVEKAHDPKTRRMRVATEDEYRQVMDALEDAPRQPVKTPGRLTQSKADVLAFTIRRGLRLNEATQLTWADIDFKRGTFTLDDTKRGRRTLRLGAEDIAMLKRRRRSRADVQLVFPNERGQRHTPSAMRISWKRAKASARVDPALRAHDFRRKFISDALAAGASLHAAGAAVGHTDAATTARYSFLSTNDQADVLAAVAKRRRRANK